MSEGKHPGGHPPIFKTPEELEQKITEYFKSTEPQPITYEDEEGNIKCLTDKRGNPVFKTKPPTIAGLAYFLGFADRQSIYDNEKRNDEFSYVIKRARLSLEAYHEGGLSTSSTVAGHIYWMNNHGWINQQKIDLRAHVRQSYDEMNDQELEDEIARYEQNSEN